MPEIQLQRLEEILYIWYGIIVIPTDLSKAGSRHDALTNEDICHCGTRGGRHGASAVCLPATSRASTLPRELSDIAPVSPPVMAWVQLAVL